MTILRKAFNIYISHTKMYEKHPIVI